MWLVGRGCGLSALLNINDKNNVSEIVIVYNDIHGAEAKGRVLCLELLIQNRLFSFLVLYRWMNVILKLLLKSLFYKTSMCYKYMYTRMKCTYCLKGN